MEHGPPPTLPPNNTPTPVDTPERRALPTLRLHTPPPNMRARSIPQMSPIERSPLRSPRRPQTLLEAETYSFESSNGVNRLSILIPENIALPDQTRPYSTASRWLAHHNRSEPPSTVASSSSSINSHQGSDEIIMLSPSSGSRVELNPTIPKSPSRLKRSKSSLTIPTGSAYQIMADHIFNTAAGERLFTISNNTTNAVAIRYEKGKYVVSPNSSLAFRNSQLEVFVAGVDKLNCIAAITVTAPVVVAIMSSLAPGTTSLDLANGETVQVVDSMVELSVARRAQMACFVRESLMLVVWSDTVDDLLQSARKWNDQLVRVVWESATRRSVLSEESYYDKEQDIDELSEAGSSIKHSESGHDIEANDNQITRRDNWQYSVVTGLSVGLDLVFCGLTAANVTKQYMLTRQWTVWLILLFLPFVFCVSLFFAWSLISSVWQLLGPVAQMNKNWLYYSGIKPEPIKENLPHLTVAMPVYKEDLESVLAPSIKDVNRAIRTYELQGGSANILICEDGLQLVSEDERKLRIDFYECNGCAYVARPGHKKNGYIRKGKFKKASNLNVAKNLSLRVEQLMDEQRQPRPTKDESGYLPWSQYDEDLLYENCLQQATAETGGKIWAAGNIRIGDYILILDADTRLPADILLAACSEMEQSPEVAILQYCSGVFLAGAGFFEKAIAFFTKVVNFMIGWNAANGCPGAFMGHNAILRWSALQEQSFVDKEDGVRKIWSEDHVSEDFVMSLNLLNAGYVVRWANYDHGYLEGVSLSVDDEISRWQKYAFGISEMLFNPFGQWYKRGPFAPVFLEFLKCRASWCFKFSTMAYILSYWSIGIALVASVTLFIVMGVWDLSNEALLPSFAVWIGVAIVFGAASTVSQICLRYRAGHAPFLRALFDQLTWLPYFLVFFGGLSYHVSTALLAHFFSYDMTWGSTMKEVEVSTLPKEFKRIFTQHWKMYVILTILLVGIIIDTQPFVTIKWQTTKILTLQPILLLLASHLALPIISNQWILSFRF